MLHAVRLELKPNVPLFMTVTDSGIETSFKELFIKACCPIATTDCGILTVFRLLQSENARSPIAVTVYVMPLYVTVEGMVTSPEYPPLVLFCPTTIFPFASVVVS